jgi:Uma2 family endonuclease
MFAVKLRSRAYSMDQSATRLRRFTRGEYERMAENGIFRPGERVELVDGEIVAMTPQRSRHSTVIYLLTKALERAFGKGFMVRVQCPLALDDHSEPEPDIAVVQGVADDYVAEHPTTAALVVEVAEATLAFDRGKKAAVYARAGIADYWVVNLLAGCVEVHRAPRRSKLNWRYAQVTTIRGKRSVSPLAKPRAKLSLAAFLR